jgi:predicted RNA-binding protein YlqC (UPF0109 family)
VPELADELRELVRLLVDRPEVVEVTETSRRRQTVLVVTVAPEDRGKVIGRQGRTARALRTLLDTRGDRRGERYELEIREG